MDRRKILLIVAAVVAALGAALVFVYAQGADQRAEDKFDAVEVLVATQQIEAGETYLQAAQSGKVAKELVTEGSLVPGSTNDGTLFDGAVALTTIYPGEQLLTTKFGESTEVEEESPVLVPGEGLMSMAIQLSDTARVAGFVRPGSEVAIFMSGTATFLNDPQLAGVDFSRVLLPKVKVLAVGSTTQLTTTTTDEAGQQTTEQLPRTVLTIEVSQRQMERVLFAQGHGELALGLLTDTSLVKPGGGVTGPDLFG